MDAEFWQSRWQQGQIGFHQDRPTPLMLKHWPCLALQPPARVFVPLCGKSLDMAWFASQGLRVLGIELSELAVTQFFAENGLQPDVSVSAYGRHYRAGPIEIIHGDAFGLDPAVLRDCDAVFDRAALIALPAAVRRRYAAEVYGALPEATRGLLITLDYPRHEKDGPPFAVPDDEALGLFGEAWQVSRLEQRGILDSQPQFVAEGVSALTTSVFRLDRGGAGSPPRGAGRGEQP